MVLTRRVHDTRRPLSEGSGNKPLSRLRGEGSRAEGGGLRVELRSRRGADPPDAIADIVGHQQSALAIDRDTDRPATGVAVLIEESGQDVDRLSRPACPARRERRSPCSRWAACGSTSRAGRRTRRWRTAPQRAAVGERQAERGGVRAERVVRHDRPGDQVGPLRLDARVDMLAVIAVRPAVEAAVAERRSCNRARDRCRSRRAR